jgi:hypothetical protein
MSDLQTLLGTQTAAEPEQPKKKQAPKPKWLADREKATGIDGQWDEKANAGRGGWVLPGLSSKMGGPPGVKAGQQQPDPKLAAVSALVEAEKWAEAQTEFAKLDATLYKGNADYERMRKLIQTKLGK